MRHTALRARDTIEGLVHTGPGAGRRKKSKKQTALLKRNTRQGVEST